MPRAILALRRYPATMLLAAMLFAASLILAATSLGTVSGGGEGDDGGSGIGGTGKSGEFGGSGFGGTGGPSPFFTSAAPADDQQEATLEADAADATPQLAEAPAVADTVLIELSSTLDTSAVVQPEQIDDIATPLNTEPTVLVEVAQASAQERSATPDPVVTPQIEPSRLAEESMPAPEAELAAVNTGEPAKEELSETPATLPVQVEQVLETEVGGVVKTANVPAESVVVAQESEEEARHEPADRASVPERIQRPDLPPFQRIRPVERPSLLPSRVQPMRI